MASSKCSIDDCKRNSDHACDHCQRSVCTKHYIEHVKLANGELPNFSDELNTMINTMQQHDFSQYAFEQIEQWREESHRRIDNLCDEKKQQLKIEIDQKTADQMKTLRDLSLEIKELTDGGDASFRDIESIKKNIEKCRQQCQQLETRDYFRLDVKTINLETKLWNHELFTGGGTLLSLEHQIKLNEFYGKEGQTWILIYKATRDGFPSTDFHRCCNNQGPTITVIQSNDGGYLFGGYTSISWNTRQNYVQDDDNPFLFTLTNPYEIPPTKYTVKLRNHAIYDHLNYGPTFGAGHDIYVSSHSQTNKNSSFNFPHSYSDTTRRGSMTFTGNKNFQSNDIEVYRLAHT
jgi:hypothetical protein